MDFIILLFFVIVSALYMFLSIQKKQKGGFILGAVCFVVFSIFAVMVYLATNNIF